MFVKPCLVLFSCPGDGAMVQICDVRSNVTIGEVCRRARELIESFL